MFRNGNHIQRLTPCGAQSSICDLTPESRNSPLLANGSLTHVSAITSRNNPLLGNGSVSTFPQQKLNTEKRNNRGTVRHGVTYSVRPKVIKGLVYSSFERVAHELSFGIRHSLRELSVQLLSVTSGQWNLKNCPILKSKPSQPRKRGGSHSRLRNGESLW
jgi:hypothetical protein